jgi:DNA invertase Pin-like site-specific DNA recombinase
MLKLLQNGKVQGVVIHKIDRSARHLKDWADLGDVIDQGIEVHFANESIDLNSRGGRLSADIQAVVASDYIRNLREETKKGLYGRLKQGFYPLRAPVGYRDNGAAKPKTIHPEKGPLLRKAFELYASGQFTIVSLVDELYLLGLRNHNAGRVTRNGLSTILNNPFYMGLIRIRKTGEMYTGNHEPLISKRLFEQVQNALQGRLNKRVKVHEFIFRRLITCKGCGYSLIGETQKGHVYYRCHAKNCPTTGIREDRVSRAIEENLEKLRFSGAEKTYLVRAIERLKQNWVVEQERQVAALNMKLQQIADRLNRLTDAYLDQALERDLFEQRKTTLLLEKRAIEDQMTTMRSNDPSVPEALQKFVELAHDACFLYRTPLLEKKRRLVKIVSSNLTLDQKTLDFAFAPPFHEVANRNNAIDGSPSKVVARTCDALIASLLPKLEAYAIQIADLEESGGTE